MLIFESCAELAPPHPWALWESWPWKQESGGANPNLSQLQYLGEWALYIAGVMGEPAPRIGVWKSCLFHSSPSQGCGKGEIPSSLMRAGELSLPLPCCSTQESRHYPSPLMEEVWVSQPQECDHGRSGPTTCLPYSSVSKGEMPLPLPCQQAGELALPLV